MSSPEKPTPQTPAPKPVAGPTGGKTPDHPHVATASAPVPAASSHGGVKRWLVWGIVAVLVAGGAVLAAPWVRRALDTVSTDDAYINSHVTLVAPRVSGQVARVLVDDNNRVRKGDLLVELDKEPFQVEVDVAQAAVAASEADLVVAEAQTRGIEGRTRSLRFNLERSIEDVNNQIAILRSKVAFLQSQKASLAKAQADFERGEKTFATKTISKEEFDLRRESMLVAQARVHEAMEGVHQVRVSLGLPLEPAEGHDLAHVPPDLDQTFSSVRQAQASLMESAAQLGVNESFTKSPRQLVADFYKRDPKGQIDRIYDELLKNAPALKQSQAKVLQARRNLERAQLNLRYCDILSEIDGVVTRRNVNPGNHVNDGQILMAVRSLTEIWVDANFKETQLSELRIGQAVDLDVDMYGSRQDFKG